ncbi:MAG: ABC transporter permease [Acidobacteria bacterium]|nr:ABC transporter permease [Acidobacteriota bacterium]
MRWLFRLLVTDDDRRAIESDLAELYEWRRRQDGERAASRWLRRQQLAYPAHLLLDRLRAAFSKRVATMPDLWRDFTYSVRSLARTPALATTIILTVGVGLGATTGMLSVVRAVLLNPLPYADPGSLLWIYTDNPPYRFRFSVVDYRALEADHPAFSAVAAYQTTSVTLTEGDIAERVTSKAVTGSYFPLLRQTALLGRVFDQSDDARGDRTVVLTAAYWSRRFGNDGSVLGRTVNVDGVAHTIVGVLQATDGPLERDVALFTAARWPTPTRKGPFFTMVLGRLRPDVSPAAAVQMLRASSARLFPIWKSSYQDEKASWGLQDLKSRVLGEIGSTLLLVLGAVGCVLLIACANAVNLLVARALHRGRELAIRSALGASRGRLLQHLIVESGVLTAGAASVGLVVAVFALELVTTYGANYIPRLDEVRLSTPVLGSLAGLAVASGLLIFLGGLVPSVRSSRLGMDRAPRSGGRSATDGPAARRLRHALVAAEFALATPLIVAAVLVMASLGRLRDVDVGVDTARMLTAGASLPGARYPGVAERKAFWDRTLERVAALPGVDAVALADSRPPADSGNLNNFDLEDRPTPPGENQPICTWVAASPGFFRAVGLRLERGRLLDSHSSTDNVVVVDRAWADRFYPKQDILGRRFREGGCTTCPWTTVVGVVGTVKWTGLEAPDEGTVYSPFVDLPGGYLVLRTAGDPAALTATLRQAMRELDPGLALSSIATGDDLVATSLAAPRYLSVFVAIFAAAALLLSVVGIYGVMTYFVQQHTRDIGIRLALGGAPASVRRLVVVQGLRLVGVGVGVGVAAAFFTARFLTTVLFRVGPMELSSIVGVPVALMTIAAIACIAPSHRAANLDPAVILRES